MSNAHSLGPFLTEIEHSLEKEGATDTNLSAILDKVLSHFSCVVGTIHILDARSGMLKLRAQKGVPDAVVAHVLTIPLGKGIAGLAAERRQPIQVCNLQTDTSGIARSGAKETKMEGSVAVPMLVNDAVCGVLGIAKPLAYDFSEDETRLLLQIAGRIGKYIIVPS